MVGMNRLDVLIQIRGGPLLAAFWWEVRLGVVAIRYTYDQPRFLGFRPRCCPQKGA